MCAFGDWRELGQRAVHPVALRAPERADLCSAVYYKLKTRWRAESAFGVDRRRNNTRIAHSP